jgi:hypothetical protein
MKKIIEVISILILESIGLLFLSLIVYIFLSFCAWNLYPIEWNGFSRFLMAVFEIWFIVSYIKVVKKRLIKIEDKYYELEKRQSRKRNERRN